MRGENTGPRIELRVTCDGCQHLDCDRTYHAESEEYDHDWFCKTMRTSEFRADLASGRCETPKWCPLYPTLTDKIDAAMGAN